MAKSTETKTNTHTSAVKESRDQLVEDLKRVIEDAQHLAEEAKGASGEAIRAKLEDARADLEQRVQSLRGTGQHVYDEALDRAECLEEMIRKHPWRSVAIAAAAGLVLDRFFLRR
ncbi:MAG: DUF883 domain-containing protein [Opitutales bacterium]|nr:DUF883 domain-containing protein [Opitutales bacterium]